MSSRSGPVHVVTTTRRYKDKVYKAHLLRHSYREDGKVKNKTVANLSHLPDPIVDLVRRALRGESLVSAQEQFEIRASRHHGHVEAVLEAMRQLRFGPLLHSRPSRERDLVMAMVVARVLDPQSKLATTRWWHTTTLPASLGVQDATEDDLYAAMDWLLARQEKIETRLAQRHLEPGGRVLYDLSSSYFEGTKCPLAKLGYNRDGKKGKLHVNYGLVANRKGCPVSVSVFAGNTGDAKTLLPVTHKLRERFGIERMVLVGDRGMVSQKQVDALRGSEGIGWITALRTDALRKLVRSGHLQLGLFDETNLFELAHPDFPDERLIACRNPDLAALRAHKRQDLLKATRTELDTVRRMVERGRLKDPDKIGVRAGKVVNKYKMAKHFELTIGDGAFSYSENEDSIAAEAALDGIYVIRTSEKKQTMPAAEVVRTYKNLAQVERAFRSLKTLDLHVRPIRHRSEPRVRAHIFLCMLAYYVQWHMQEAWRSLLFFDEDQDAKRTRDPVAPARRSKAAGRKARERVLDDGSPVHSFRSLLADLATIVCNECHPEGAPEDAAFDIHTTPNATQKRALDLLAAIRG